MYAIIDFIKTLEKFKFGEFYFEVLKSAEFFSAKMGWMLYLDMNPKAFCSAPPPSEKVFFCFVQFDLLMMVVAAPMYCQVIISFWVLEK